MYRKYITFFLFKKYPVINIYKMIYTCEICKYTTTRKSSYIAHCKTNKHNAKVSILNNLQTLTQPS